MAIEKWLAITSVGLFAMFAGEMISVYNFMNTVSDDSIVAQGFQPDPKTDSVCFYWCCTCWNFSCCCIYHV